MGEQQCGSQPSHSKSLHEEVRASLSEYAAAVALGQSQLGHYPGVAAHVASCPACRVELDALLDLVMPAYAGQVAPAPSPPRFNLSFLRPPAVQPAEARQTWFIDDLGRLVITFADILLASQQPHMLAQAARGQALHRYTLDPPPANLTATIEVFAGDDDADLGNVQVLVDVPGRDPFDQAGIRVTLHVGDLVWERTTGETGLATFPAVPLKLLPYLRVEITLPAEE